MTPSPVTGKVGKYTYCSVERIPTQGSSASILEGEYSRASSQIMVTNAPPLVNGNLDVRAVLPHKKDRKRLQVMTSLQRITLEQQKRKLQKSVQ